MKFVNCRNKKRTEQIVSGNNNLFPRENLIFNLPFCWPTATTFLTSLVARRPYSYIHIRVYIYIYMYICRRAVFFVLLFFRRTIHYIIVLKTAAAYITAAENTTTPYFTTTTTAVVTGSLVFQRSRRASVAGNQQIARESTLNSGTTFFTIRTRKSRPQSSRINFAQKRASSER